MTDIVERLRIDSYVIPVSERMEAATEIERLRSIISELVRAYDAGAVQIASQEIGEPENDIPIHPWHDEWLHLARRAIQQ